MSINRIATVLLLGCSTLAGVAGCQTSPGTGPNSQADTGRQDDAIVASDRIPRMDRGAPEGASSNPQNDAGFTRPSGSEGTFGPNPVP